MKKSERPTKRADGYGPRQQWEETKSPAAILVSLYSSQESGRPIHDWLFEVLVEAFSKVSMDYENYDYNQAFGYKRGRPKGLVRLRAENHIYLMREQAELAEIKGRDRTALIFGEARLMLYLLTKDNDSLPSTKRSLRELLMRLQKSGADSYLRQAHKRLRAKHLSTSLSVLREFAGYRRVLREIAIEAKIVERGQDIVKKITENPEKLRLVLLERLKIFKKYAIGGQDSKMAAELSGAMEVCLKREFTE